MCSNKWDTCLITYTTIKRFINYLMDYTIVLILKIIDLFETKLILKCYLL
jgi:hypothetical protein